MTKMSKFTGISLLLLLMFFTYINVKLEASEKNNEISSYKVTSKKVEKKDKAVFTSASEIKWVKPFGEGSDVLFGGAYGKTQETAHGTFGKFPPKFKTPVHTHSYGYHAVVLSGTITNPMKGDTQNPKKMGKGSYWYVPGNAAHETACISEEPCVFYLHQDKKFDFIEIKQKK